MEIKIGDVVKATAGRDKNGFFLVIDIIGKFAYIANGKNRKIRNLKKKNLKHLIKAAEATLYCDAVRIKRGEAFGNEKLYKNIIRATKKIGG